MCWCASRSLASAQLAATSVRCACWQMYLAHDVQARVSGVPFSLACRHSSCNACPALMNPTRGAHGDELGEPCVGKTLY
eukprot:15482778-Alexandrium_andersonii.AAC.1